MSRGALLAAAVLAVAASGCGAGASSRPTTPAPATTPAATAGLRIGLATVYVDDQDRALGFYTGVLGFVVRDDVTAGGYRWLTVAAPGDATGPALQLALDDNPAGKAYQEALFAASQPAVMLFTDDLAGEYQRISARGATFTLPPTAVTGSTIATLDDTCGNLVQLTELAR